MTTYKQGQVVLIPFPFTDLTTIKQRPALIISPNRFNKLTNDVILAAITSHITSRLSEFDFLLTEAEQRACGLPKSSMIKLGKIITMDKRLIRKVIGEMPKDTLERIKARFIDILK